MLQLELAGAARLDDEVLAAAAAPGVAERADEDRVASGARSPPAGRTAAPCGARPRSARRAAPAAAPRSRGSSCARRCGTAPGCVAWKTACGDALRRLAAVVAGEHAVDVGPVERPRAAARVDAEHVHRRNDDDAPAQLAARPRARRRLRRGTPPAATARRCRSARCRAVRRPARGAAARCRRTEVVVRDVEVVAQRRRHVEQDSQSVSDAHRRRVAMIRAISDPS